jgi:hypothetical protein
MSFLGVAITILLIVATIRRHHWMWLVASVSVAVIAVTAPVTYNRLVIPPPTHPLSSLYIPLFIFFTVTCLLALLGIVYSFVYER